MQTKIAERLPVRGPLRMLLRLPIWLYRLQLGWLQGERGLMLTHIGRSSGRVRQTVLEVGGRRPIWRASRTVACPRHGAGWTAASSGMSEGDTHKV